MADEPKNNSEQTKKRADRKSRGGSTRALRLAVVALAAAAVVMLAVLAVRFVETKTLADRLEAVRSEQLAPERTPEPTALPTPETRA